MAKVVNSISSTSSGDSITVVANYSALPDPTTVSGKFYWCSASQGTSWLPGGLGGTYYNSGTYYSNGVTWEFLNVPYQATQSEVNTGTNTDKFITPKTLRDAVLRDATSLIKGVAKLYTDLLNSNTDGSVHQSALVTEFALKQTNFHKDASTSTAVTGTTANTILVSHLIPANTFAVGTAAEVRCNIQRVGSNASATYRMYTNTSNSLSGAVQLGFYTSTITAFYAPFKRLFAFKTGNVIFGSSSISTLLNDEAVSSSTPSSNTFDPTVDNYIIIAVQPTNASDSFTSELFTIKGNK